MRWPAGFQGGTKVDRLAAHIDILPTILEACGVAAPAGREARRAESAAAAADPAAAWPDRTLVIQCNSNGPPTRELNFAAITERWKLVQPCGTDKDFFWLAWYSRIAGRPRPGQSHVFDGIPRFELYDLIADPARREDLAAKHPDIVARLRQQYNAWFDDISANAGGNARRPSEAD